MSKYTRYKEEELSGLYGEKVLGIDGKPLTRTVIDDDATMDARVDAWEEKCNSVAESINDKQYRFFAKYTPFLLSKKQREKYGNSEV